MYNQILSMRICVLKRGTTTLNLQNYQCLCQVHTPPPTPHPPAPKKQGIGAKCASEYLDRLKFIDKTMSFHIRGSKFEYYNHVLALIDTY